MQEDNIILVALTSGNVIVGEAIDGKTNTIQMNHPVAIVKIADEVNNRMTQALVPYAPLAEGPILIQPTAIEYVAAPLQKLADQYRSMISGIALPESKQIITAA